MAQMILGAKIRQISYISKFWSEINASSTKYSYISNQKFAIIGVDNPVILYSAAHSLAFAGYVTQQGLRFAHPCLWSVSPSEFLLLFLIKTGVTLCSPLPMVCQPFGLDFFSRASYKEYDSPCSSDWPRTDCTRPLPRAHDTVKFWFIIGLNSVIDFGRFNLTPIDTQSIPEHYPNQTARWDRGWVEARGKMRAGFCLKGGLFPL